MAATGKRVLSASRLCAISFGWGCLVLVAGFWLPGYTSVATTCHPGPGGECTDTESSSTLVAVNGYGVLYWLAVPVIASALVSGLVSVAERAGRPAHLLAGCVVGATWVVALVSLASVGLFFVPSAVLLSIAAARMSAATDAPAPAR
jgi:hypothetical protein